MEQMEWKTRRKIMSERKLHIKTWGCQMNVYDSNKMADVLAPVGYRLTDDPAAADMIILNTCHIREKATDKVFSELGRLREIKDARAAQGQKMLLAVAGCVAQAEGEFIIERAPYVDMVFGPQTYHLLPEMVLDALGDDAKRKRVVNTDFPTEAKFDFLPAAQSPDGPSAFLAIQEGCDKFCTFCVVPYTRGAEFSRPVSAILDEARNLRDQGACEITLLGQNVNAYHGAGPNGRTVGLGALIAAVAEIEGISRVRYMTSHPKDMDQNLIDAHRDIDKLMPYLHLPIQSGSDEILEKMNRKHTAAHYLDIVAALRKARPDIALSTDFIVGFPGESEAHFEESLALIREAGFASSFSFKYSPRPGTPAANMPGLLREDVKSERLQRLQDLLYSQHIAFNASCVGKTMPVLFDRPGKGQDEELHGRTAYNQSIHVKGKPRLIGQILPVEITGAFPNSLAGKLETGEYMAA